MKLFLLFFVFVTILVNSSAQNVGIGTNTPLARLHVDSTALFTGTQNFPAVTNPPVTGAGTRMMWYPVKGALRSGEVSATQWDRDNIGYTSFATGYNTTASGNSAAALGYITTASGLYSMAWGENNNASGRAATATGYFTSAPGFGSAAFGYFTTAKAYNSFTAGIYNDDTDVPNPNSQDLQDRIFQVGNGAFNARKNAFTILRNGNIGIGTVNPNAPLQFGNTSSNRKLVFWESSNNDHEFYGFGINGSTLRYQTASAGGDHAFYSALDPVTSREIMRLKGDGKVGIGTSSPNATLEAQSNVTGIPILRLSGVNEAYQDFYPLGNAGGRYGWLGFSASEPNKFFIFNDRPGDMSFITGGGERLILKSNGNVGIGVPNPLEKLEVSGKTKTTELQITSGAAAGKVLTSDAAGNASWQAGNINTGIEVSTFASQVVNSGVTSKVIFDLKYTDPAIAFSIANSEWTIPSAGFYHIGASVKFFTMLPANTEVVLYLRVNGITIKNQNAKITGQSTIDISADIALAANDIVTVYIIQNSGAVATITNGRENVWLSGFKVY